MARRSNVRITDSSRLPQIMRDFHRLAEQEIFIGMQGDAELAMIAGVHEYGSMKMKIPARSFIGVGKKRATAPIKKRVKEGLQRIADGYERPDRMLRDIGEIGLDRVIKRFTKIRKPALSPIYARKKGNKKVLLREEDLKNSLLYKIGPRGSRGQ